MNNFALPPDIPDYPQIITGHVPPFLDDPARCGVLWHATQGRFMLEVPGVARYLVEQGKQITIDPLAENNTEAINRFLNWTPLAALWLQRGLLAFHAAAAERDGRSLILTGDSGAGKSTLIAELVRRGWRLLADELTLTVAGGSGNLLILPTSQQVLLWPSALEQLGIAVEDQRPGDLQRRGWQPEQTKGEACPVNVVVHLSVHGHSQVEVEPVSGGKRFQMLGSLLYNSHIADLLLDKKAFLTLGSKLAQVPWHRLRRPRVVWNLAGLADHIEGVFDAI